MRGRALHTSDDSDLEHTAEGQRSYFSAASVAVIPHGAGMTNVPFLRNGSIAVVENKFSLKGLAHGLRLGGAGRAADARRGGREAQGE